MKIVKQMILMSILIIFAATSVQAHMLWLNVSDYTPEPGKEVKVEIGWGHAFPKTEVTQSSSALIMKAV